ncbi:MAG: hypothetical protein MJ230_04495 [bacterium]|nr:hypothetical protein [bacterium]
MNGFINKYLPFGLIAVALIFQYNLFATPMSLEVKHREILGDVASTYATKQSYIGLKEDYNDLKSQLNTMQAKIDKIYEVIMEGGYK